MKKTLKNWFIDLELALIAGAFITLLLVIFSPFYMNTSFMIQPICNATISQILKTISIFTIPTIICIVIYTIKFFIKK